MAVMWNQKLSKDPINAFTVAHVMGATFDSTVRDRKHAPWDNEGKPGSVGKRFDFVLLLESEMQSRSELLRRGYIVEIIPKCRDVLDPRINQLKREILQMVRAGAKPADAETILKAEEQLNEGRSTATNSPVGDSATDHAAATSVGEEAGQAA